MSNWLPENVTLKLTALEAGWLAGVLSMEKNAVEENKPDEHGNPVPIKIRDRVLEKLWEAVEPLYEKHT